MTMDMSDLLERVSQQYSRVEQIDDSVLCFARMRNNQPFAIYYFDIDSHLPNTIESLNEYQDRLIGKRYFDGRKSLQWSNYLYFLRSEEELASSEVKRAKELIESDRTYARKFVIPEQEIDSILVPHIVSPTREAKKENVLSVWIDLLTKAGLDQAIFSETDLPTRLRHIESDAKKEGTAVTSIKSKTVKPAQFINSLELNQYRPFPLARKFDFGTVNLITGPNASGKTSLLEAIELFYCGRNKRNPDRKPTYRLDAVLADGASEKATSQRAPNVFRDRNLYWYGQSEVRTNNLYKSFAQFNFLDTDAAVELSESTDHIEEDLSKLLVGPDASKIWRDIERVNDAVNSKLKELRPYKRHIETELSQLKKLLSDIAGERRQSDIILDQLSKMLERHNWRTVEDAPELFLESLNGSLTELLSIAQQAIELKWVESPATYAGLEKFVQETSRLIDVAKPSLLRLTNLNNEITRSKSAINQFKQARELVNDIIRYIDADYLELVSKYAETKKTIERCAKLLRSYDNEFITILSDVEAHKTVKSSLLIATEERSKAETMFSADKKQYNDFAMLRDDSIKLSQQLRHIASALIQKSDNPEECPLCHTQFEPGELMRHMSFEVDKKLEAFGQSLLSRMRESENILKQARNLETALAWLRQFCQNSLEYVDPEIHKALSYLQSVQKELADAQYNHKVFDKEIVQLTAAGFSIEQYEKLLSELTKMGFILRGRSKESADQILSQIAERESSQSEKIENLTNDLSEIEADLKIVLGVDEGEADYEDVISMMGENVTATESIISRLSKFYGEFQWSKSRPISDLIATADGIRKVASEASVAIVREQRVDSQRIEGLKRQEELEEKLKKQEKRLQRFCQAQKVFENIRNEHSLKQAMEEVLQINREAIETIFASIHSPAEFSGLGSSFATLVRKVDNSRAKLTEISTGQRAAFGLSVFLAQNSQLVTAPPVVLIDDPIAHVDDLNSLSFLDYLREIALTGKRQIFFATANDKLATLFERKFDFLGEGQFRRFSFSREG